MGLRSLAGQAVGAINTNQSPTQFYFMKKILFLFALAIACVAFSTEKTFAAGPKDSRTAHKQTISKEKASPQLVSTRYIYALCTDGSFEPIISITTFSSTVGSQTVTTTVIATRLPSVGCTAPFA